jgi:Flp pilus assembly protein TadG
MMTIIRSLGLDSSRRRQSGQLLPIAAVAFLLMCGLAGLAIDSSRDYLVKRQAQNAADFATLAAAKQLSLSGSLSGPLAPNSNPVKVAHDFAANNGFATNYSNACDSTGAAFTTTWFNVGGLPCNATTGFTNKVTINSPPVGFAGYPVPSACSGSGRFACLQVTITAAIPQLFTSILGIPTAYVSVAATAQVTLPASAFSTPPPNALILYQPQAGCNEAEQQCFDETKAVARAQLSCTGTNNCPTFWTTASVSIYGFDGVTLTPPGDLTTLQSNGDMVIQQRTTICDPYNGAACARNTVVGARGFATAGGSNLYCQRFGGGASILTPCTTTGQAGLQELDASQSFFSPQYYWTPTVDTSGLRSCGSLVLNGGPVSGPCADAQEPYSINPGRYGSIVINHGTYEFDTGLFDITGSATVNNITGGGYTANGIDHSRETATDFDLCTGGLPNSCPNLTAGVWIGHGGGAFGAYVPPTSGTCIGSVGGGSSGGGGDATVVTGSGAVFRLEAGAGGFVSTNEVQGLTLSGAGVGALASVGGSPLLFDNEGSTFIHLDARASSNNLITGVVYQAPGATAGGVEMNLGMTSGGGRSALLGQILAYSFTAFGQTGTMDFQSGYGSSSLPGIATSGRNETSIINSVTLAAAAGQPNYSTLTVNYTDEWSMDAYDTYIKVNNGSPIFFSQGIWNSTPGPGSPLPPPGNNPGDQYPAYPSSSGAYTIISNSPPDWVYNIPNSGGSSIEVTGSWTWGHESDIPGANSGNYTAQIRYTFPNPSGNYVAVSIFTTDGDHCGDYDIANYTFRNTGQPAGGTQTVGSVSLVQ